MIEQPPFQPGDTFNEEFEILHLLGSGGSAWVYRVREKFTGLEFALKLIPNKKDSDFERRARAEIVALHRLVRHPNIVQIFNAGIAADRSFFFIKMELLEGLSLREVLDELKFLGLAELLSIGADICCGIGAAHQRQIIHRDIKPANVLVGPGNDVKVLDFGVVKIHDEKRDTTGRLRWRGTPLYMSPEHLQGERVTPQSDVYALGLMFHEALLGRHFCHMVGQEPPSWVTIGWMQILEPVPALADLVPGFPRSLSEIIARATDKSPSKRWRDAAELGGALAAELRSSELLGRMRGYTSPMRDLVAEAKLVRRRRLESTAEPRLADASTVAGNVLEPFERTTAKLVLPSVRRSPSRAAAPARFSRQLPMATIERPAKVTVPNAPAALRGSAAAVGAAEPTNVVSTPPAVNRRAAVPAERTRAVVGSDLRMRPRSAEPSPVMQPKAGPRRGVLSSQSLPYLYAAAVVLGVVVSVPLGLFGARAVAAALGNGAAEGPSSLAVRPPVVRAATGPVQVAAATPGVPPKPIDEARITTGSGDQPPVAPEGPARRAALANVPLPPSTSSEPRQPHPLQRSAAPIPVSEPAAQPPPKRRAAAAKRQAQPRRSDPKRELIYRW